jgi:hypothetical protein
VPAPFTADLVAAASAFQERMKRYPPKKPTPTSHDSFFN